MERFLTFLLLTLFIKPFLNPKAALSDVVLRRSCRRQFVSEGTPFHFIPFENHSVPVEIRNLLEICVTILRTPYSQLLHLRFTSIGKISRPTH